VYKEFQTISHQKAKLRYEKCPESRPFPVPRPMLKNRLGLEKREHYDVIIVSDFRLPGGTTSSNVEELVCQRQAGLKTGILSLWTYSLNVERRINDKIYDLIDDRYIKVLEYGDKVSCDLLLFRFPPILNHGNRYFPDILAENVVVIVNQT